MNYEAYLWPLAFLLLALLVLHHLREAIRPVISSIISGLAKHAASNAPAYAIAIGFGLSASLSAFIDVFHALRREDVDALSYHQYFSLWAKVLNPFAVAILAYATQSKFRATNSDTQPPFSK